jgi:hypothetical protein
VLFHLLCHSIARRLSRKKGIRFWCLQECFIAGLYTSPVEQGRGDQDKWDLVNGSQSWVQNRVISVHWFPPINLPPSLPQYSFTPPWFHDIRCKLQQSIQRQDNNISYERVVSFVINTHPFFFFCCRVPELLNSCDISFFLHPSLFHLVFNIFLAVLHKPALRWA